MNNCIFCLKPLINKTVGQNISLNCLKCKNFDYLTDYKNVILFWQASYKNCNILSSTIENSTVIDNFIDDSISSVEYFFNIPKSQKELDGIINTILLYK